MTITKTRCEQCGEIIEIESLHDTTTYTVCDECYNELIDMFDVLHDNIY